MKQSFSRTLIMRILPFIPLIGLGQMASSWSKWEGIYFIPILFISVFTANAIWSLVTPIVVITIKAIHIQLMLGRVKTINLITIQTITINQDNYIEFHLKNGQSEKVWWKMIKESEQNDLKNALEKINEQLQ